MQEFLRLGGEIRYQTDCVELLTDEVGISGVHCTTPEGQCDFAGDAIVLGCGGFEASAALRGRYLGEDWVRAKVRGTRHNTGAGIEMALACGAAMYGRVDGCHAVPMDLNMPDYGNTDLPYVERKHYRKICYFLGIMLNAAGQRFVDEGLSDPQEERLGATDFGSYPVDKFTADLEGFNDGEPLNFLQRTLVTRSYETIVWLNDHNVQFDPIYSRQSFRKADKYIFWGGLTLEAR